MRFFLSAKKKKRIFAKHQKVYTLFLQKVTTGEMPKANFWSRYFKAAARHRRRSVRREAGQAAEAAEVQWCNLGGVNLCKRRRAHCRVKARARPRPEHGGARPRTENARSVG